MCMSKSTKWERGIFVIESTVSKNSDYEDFGQKWLRVGTLSHAVRIRWAWAKKCPNVSSEPTAIKNQCPII